MMEKASSSSSYSGEFRRRRRGQTELSRRRDGVECATLTLLSDDLLVQRRASLIDGLIVSSRRGEAGQTRREPLR